MGKRHSSEQIVYKLRDAEAKLAGGATVPEVARELGTSEATFHRWGNQCVGMSPVRPGASRNSKRKTRA